MIDSTDLRGRSKDEAERYGKPSIGAHYLSETDAHKYTREPGARCAVCGHLATEAHHWPPLGRSAKGIWTLRTPKGFFPLKPALFALCRYHHVMFHANALKANWVWNSDDDERAWWDGSILSEVNAGSKELYGFGHWEFIFKDGSGFTYGEVNEDGQRKAVRAQLRPES